jgi:NTP pyrophosphatase (non-canonical NTP hydrolase)
MTSNEAYSLATTQAVVRALYDEGDRARRKHGDAPLATNAEALSVLMEEVGEVAMALNQNLPKEELKKELVMKFLEKENA